MFKHNVKATSFLDDHFHEEIFENQILTSKEVAQLLKVSEKTVYKMAKRGEIPHFRLKKLYRFLYPELVDWINQRS